MAYFYQHIKGLTSGGYNWKINVDELAAAPAGYWSMNTPAFSFNDGTSHDEGNFITSLAEYGRIKENFYFLNKVYFCEADTDPDAPEGSIGNYRGYIGHDNAGLVLKGGSSEGNSPVLNINADQYKMQGVSTTQILFRTPNDHTVPAYDITDAIYKIDVNSAPINFTIQDGSDYRGLCICKFSDNSGTYTYTTGLPNWQCKIYTNIPFYSHEYIKLAGSSGYINADGYIHSGSYIEGLYFNATSDKRAKTGIVQSTFSALNIIKSLPIYNFKYKSDGSDSIGIIAQQALKVNAGDFSLVANAQASGENGDYMSVKESKLVYVAWKAIQEQQEIIDKQSKEIEELKQLVKTLIEK